jgi:hypothetical protein
MSTCATSEEALAFVREHGVVLVSAKGSVPRLTEAIAGEPIQGSWWAHPQSHHIFAVLTAVVESEQVLACRLINGKVTLVHRRLWPSLVRLAARFAPAQLAKLREEHTASGRHVTHEMPFPEWVPAEVLEQARATDENEAVAVFGAWPAPSGTAGKRVRPPK